MCADIANVHRSSQVASASVVTQTPVYRWVVGWCLFSPLLWSLPGMPDFVVLTLTANAAAVVVLPLLCGSLWYITARTRFIGRGYRNKWWENALMGGLFVLSVWGAYQSVVAIGAAFHS
ncbi:MAG: hypothetical protein ACKVQA_20130 [Burkholderiales bacterium]